MRIFWTLFRRELAAFFLSVAGYIIIAGATFLTAEGFVVLINGIGNDPSPSPITEMFYSTFYFWLVILLATPVITMRLFALEKATGTFETLMTTPVSEFQIVSAKFASALFSYIVMWLPMFGCLFIVWHFSNQSGALDAGMVGGMALGTFLVGCLFLSFGCLASALSRTQMAAAMISFAFGVGMFSLAYLAKKIPVTEQWQAKALSYFSLFDQMEDFARGVVDSRAVIFYSSLTLLALFLTLRVVEFRRWK
ncbi:MAG TPA: ABC transporter permease [Verrucomicrobiae bacterium]|nr:ABC transporter permease [Verrucomicrobiae bacterium]